MWTMILSLDPIVDELRPAFTQPSYGTRLPIFCWLDWIGASASIPSDAPPRMPIPTVCPITPNATVWTVTTTFLNAPPRRPRVWRIASAC